MKDFEKKTKEDAISKPSSNKVEELASFFMENYETPRMPESLKGHTLLSCLKYTDSKELFLVKEDATKEMRILKGGEPDRIRAEYEAYRSMEDAAFPKVHSFFYEGEKAYFLRDYVEGVTLATLVERESVKEAGGLKTSEGLALMEKVCAGVLLLHQKNPPLVHRDIKPENLILRPDGGISFIDLDTVRRFDPKDSHDTVYLGTRETAAPEQFGFQQTSVRTDVYSLGILFLYLMTGSYDIRTTQWKSLPSELQSCIRKCLSFDPDRRYRDVGRLLSDIKCLKRTRFRMGHFAGLVAALALALSLAAFGGTSYLRHYHYVHDSVHFANPMIEEAVRQSLGVEEEEVLYASDLEGVTTIALCGDRIFTSWEEHQAYHDTYWTEFTDAPEKEEQDFSDLSYFPNLTTLVLDNQGLSDLTEIGRLEKLRQVSFLKNRIVDVSPLANCTSLNKINLGKNPLADVSPLASLKDLTELRMAETEVEDISILSGSNIRILDITYTLVSDHRCIGEFTQLKQLIASNVQKEDVEYLGKLKNMELLSIFDSYIPDLSVFSELTHLECLDMTGARGISSLEGIEQFPALTYLGLARTKITDLSPIERLSMLEMLDVTDAAATDLSVVEHLPRLTTLWIDSGKEAFVGRLSLDGVEVVVN